MIAQPIAYSAFDTLKFLQKLKASGMPERQAIALTEAQNEALMETTSHMLATKTDISDVKREIADVRREIADVRYELKGDISALRHEVKEDMSGLRSNVKLLNWMMSFLLAGVGALILKAFFT